MADLLILAAATVGALTVERDAFKAQVVDRPWPARVTPTGPWTATLEGSGRRVTVTGVVGAIPDALSQATFRLPDYHGTPLELTLPDGGAWHPTGTFRLETTGPLAFTSVRAQGGVLDLGADSLPFVLGSATGPITAVGTFTAADGRQVDRLPLPPTTRVEDCAERCGAVKRVPEISLSVGPGTALGATSRGRHGEAAVAGGARAAALGRTWDGLVGAVEGLDVRASATWNGQTWSVSATADRARQVWVDVWPVADTTLAVTSEFDPDRRGCFRDCSVGLRWTNAGWATSQVYEVEGLGAGASKVGFGLAESSGHDAGLGISRGGRTRNLSGGDDIHTNQVPQQRLSRGLTYRPGTEATLVLRGNFPEVSVRLAIPAERT